MGWLLPTLLIAFAARTFAASNCSTDSAAGPVALPIRDVRLSNGHTMRGVPLQVGTPSQTISALPNSYLNDTWIWSTDEPLCWNSTTDRQCVTYRGGHFDVDESSTSKRFDSVQAAGGDPSDVQRDVGLHIWENSWVRDDLSVGDITLDSFPIGLPEMDMGDPSNTQANIGLGLNSTFFTALKDANRISSRSFSFWWGLNGATKNAQMDGSIVFGGYDRAKTTGSAFTKKLQTPSLTCDSGIIVSISDLSLRFPNATESTLNGPNTVEACVQFGASSMLSLPWEPYWLRFETLTETQMVEQYQGAEGLSFGSAVYDVDNVFSGSMKVEIDASFGFEIPNSQLVIPPREIQPDGSIALSKEDEGTVAVWVNPTKGVNSLDASIVGGRIFQEVYLSVNYDEGTYTLWRANATEEVDLVAFGSGDGECDADDQRGSGSSGSNETEKSAEDQEGDTSEAGAESTTASNSGSDSLSIGAIVGVSVGSAAAVAVAASLLILFCVRSRRRRRREKESWPAGLTEADSSFALQNNDYPSRNELKTYETGGTPMHELETTRAYELGANTPVLSEMPANTNWSSTDVSSRK